MPTKDKIDSWAALKEKVAHWKKDGEKVVFSNGCFDIVHLGHIDYLEKARNKGTKLIIGLNTDASVNAIKGPTRPINNQNARARMLAAMEFVDGVTFFDEDTPLLLIETLAPDILVKGDDYLAENIVGADFVISNGGSVETVALVEGYSTSAIIERIKN